MIENDENFTLTNYLNISHPEIINSIKKEEYIFDYDGFDLFYEIKMEDEFVGFITLENDDLNKSWIINECYVMPEWRGNNLFFKNFVDIVKGTEKKVFIRKPNRNLINVLLNNNLAFKMPNDIVISYVDFIIELKDAFKNSKIKHNYKKVKNETAVFIANLFDFNMSCVLFFDDSHIFSKKYDVLCICEARKYDLKKYSIRKKLKKIQSKYLDETFNVISDNLASSFDYFKNSDVKLSNSNKIRSDFLTENPDFNNDSYKITPVRDFIFNCPFCGELTQKSAIHCRNCGFNLEKTLIRDENKDNIVAIEDYDDFTDSFSDSIEYDNENMLQAHDEIRNIFDSEDEMREAFSKLTDSIGEMALISKELQKEPVNSLNIIDYDYLELDKDKYDSKEHDMLNIEKSIYCLVKYTNEHPTPWKYDYYLNDIDDNAFGWIIEKGYVTKVMPDKYYELFKDYTVEELKRESESYHDPETTKEDMIEHFIEWSDYSWIVSEKGLEYLESNPFLEFFTNNLMGFNIYEFKLFSDKNCNEMTIEEIGDKYINAKLKKALSNDELDIYLYYADYYFNLNLSKKEYETALIYLIQRIIYEINIWHLKEYHFALDEALSIRTDYLLFKITKLGLDFDLKTLYDEAYNSLKIEKIKFKYDENFVNVERMINGESVYDISDELLDKAKEQGRLKSLLTNEIIR